MGREIGRGGTERSVGKRRSKMLNRTGIKDDRKARGGEKTGTANVKDGRIVRM
jgi:hypothetical protein